MKSPVRSWSVVLLGLLVLTGCAGSPATNDRRGSAAGDADQLMAAALRTWAVARNPTEALQLAEDAALAAPQRPEVAFMHLRACAQVSGCDSQALEVRLRKLAPDNAAVWVSALARAQAKGDAQVTEQVLAQIGRTPRFDVYWTTLLSRITTAIHASAPEKQNQASGSLTTALNDATGWLSALVLPTFEPISAACSAHQLRDAVRRTNCERVARVLQRGDAYAAEGLGLGIEQRLANESTMAGLQIERRIDTLGYRNHQAGAVMAAQPTIEQDKFSAEVIELMKQLPREQDVSLAILRWAGKPLKPE